MKKNILISIHKKYCDKLISGEKKVEFRKKIPKENVDKVFIYESRSKRKCKLIGYFTIKDVAYDTIDNLWDCYKDVSGIDKEGFYEYFKNHEKGYAVVLDELHIGPIRLDIKKAPQSYYYVTPIKAKRYSKSILYMEKIYNLLNNDLEYFPELIEWFDNAVYSDDYIKILNKEFYAILNPNKNKICRIEKLSKNIDLECILETIHSFIDKLKVYIPKTKENVIEAFSRNNFVVTKIINSKYKENDKVYLMEEI